MLIGYSNMSGKAMKILGVCLYCGTLVINTSACARSEGLEVGQEARRLKDSIAREQNSGTRKGMSSQGIAKTSINTSEPVTIYESIALVTASGYKKRSKSIRKLLHNNALGKIPYEKLAIEAERWSKTAGGFTMEEQDKQKQNLEDVWWVANLALAYTIANQSPSAVKALAREQLFLESIEGFWARLNAQRFLPIINVARQTLQNEIKNGSLTKSEKQNLLTLERELFRHNSRIIRINTTSKHNKIDALIKNKNRGVTLLPPPEILSITYTPALFDRVFTSAMPPIKVGAKRKERSLPPAKSLHDAIKAMPFLGIFAVPPSDVRIKYPPSEENLVIKITYAVAWSLIDLQYRKSNLAKQNYTQSRRLLVSTLKMLISRLALVAYDRALQKFSDKLWEFQQQERMLLRTKLSSDKDPQAQEFLKTYSLNLISALEASESYAQSITWSLRLALLSGYLQVPEIHKISRPSHLASSADKVEASLRQTPGLLHAQTEKYSTRLVYGLPTQRQQALERITEARIAMQENAKANAKLNLIPSATTALHAILPTTKMPHKNLFEQGSHPYRQLPNSLKKETLRLKQPTWLQR